jgi:hypothetical protein
MTSASTAEGVGPIEIVDGETLEFPWSGVFGAGGTFNGEFDGTETLFVEALGSDVDIEFEGEFETIKVE